MHVRVRTVSAWGLVICLGGSPPRRAPDAREEDFVLGCADTPEKCDKWKTREGGCRNANKDLPFNSAASRTRQRREGGKREVCRAGQGMRADGRAADDRDRMVVGTAAGELFLVEGGDVRATLGLDPPAPVEAIAAHAKVVLSLHLFHL